MSEIPPQITTQQESENTTPRSPAGKRVFAATIAWMAIIFATSCTFIDRDLFVSWIWRFLPSESARQTFARAWDGGGGLVVVKGYHMAEFALLFLLIRTVARKMVRARNKATWIAAGLAIAFAASDEWHQTFVPGRGGTVIDVLIDTSGVCIAALLPRWAA